MPVQVLESVPVLLRIPGLAAKVFKGQRAFMALLDDLVAEHKRTRDPAQPPRDLTDAFLDEVEKVRGSCQGWGRGCGFCHEVSPGVGPPGCWVYCGSHWRAPCLCPFARPSAWPGQGGPQEQLQQ